MLEALDDSLGAQRQLVADASHELRTPIASIRTNIEVLAHSDLISDHEREALLTDVVEQLEELTGLIGDLIDLARDAENEQEAGAACSASTSSPASSPTGSGVRNPGVAIDTELHAERRSRGRGAGRARNLEPARQRRQVEPARTARSSSASSAGELSVRDHGPGIGPGDLPHVFDRFYRSPHARGLPGSGLGLAIVRQVAETAGGSVSAGERGRWRGDADACACPTVGADAVNLGDDRPLAGFLPASNPRWAGLFPAGGSILGALPRPWRELDGIEARMSLVIRGTAGADPSSSPPVEAATSRAATPETTANTPVPGAHRGPDDAAEGGTLTVLAVGDVDYIDPGAAYYQFSYMVTRPRSASCCPGRPTTSTSPRPTSRPTTPTDLRRRQDDHLRPPVGDQVLAAGRPRGRLR